MESVQNKKQQLLKQWWDEDYSWDGLAKKPVRRADGHTTTLQDLWSCPEHQLVEFEGRRWTRFHLPAAALDGRTSPKANWLPDERQAFDSELRTRLQRAAQQYETNPSQPIETIAGVVFPEGFRLRDVSERIVARFVSCIFNGGADFSNVNFNSALGLSGCVIDGDIKAPNALFREISMEDVVVTGLLDLTSNRGLAGLSMVRCVIGGSASVHAFITSPLSLKNSTFHDTVTIGGRLASDLTLYQVSVRKTFSLGGIQVPGATRMEETTFHGDALFAGNQGMDKGLFLKNVTFLGLADFSGRNILGAFEIHDLQCATVVRFHGCSFNCEVMINSDFGGAVDFRGANFTRPLAVARRTFGGEADFSGAHFHAGVDMQGVEFKSQAIFWGTNFIRGPYKFAGAVFRSLADFREKDTPGVNGEVDFCGTDFRQVADFSGRHFKGRTDFSEARFGDLPLFHECEQYSDTSFRGVRLTAYSAINRRTGFSVGWKGWLEWAVMRMPAARSWFGILNARRNSAAEQFEAAYLKLRRLCAGNEHADQELLFYEAQMRARRTRTDVPFTERMLNLLFDYLGGYGRQVAQPLIWLVTFWLLTSLAARAYQLSVGLSVSYWETARFVAHQLLVPPILWPSSQRIQEAPLWAQMLYETNKGLVTWGSLIGFLVTLALLAVFLISLRRRFALHRQ